MWYVATWCDMHRLPFASWFTQTCGVCFIAFMCWKRKMNPFQHLDTWKRSGCYPWSKRPWKFIFKLLKTYIHGTLKDGFDRRYQISSSLNHQIIKTLLIKSWNHEKSNELTILIPLLPIKTHEESFLGCPHCRIAHRIISHDPSMQISR